jgi:hypothetical protein
MKLRERLSRLYDYYIDRYLALLGERRRNLNTFEARELIAAPLLDPQRLRALWAQLDDLSQLAVAEAYHNDGEFVESAFLARYGRVPYSQSKYDLDAYYRHNKILFDLFIWENHIPDDMLPLLASIVPPVDPFRLTGLPTPPDSVLLEKRRLEPIVKLTEQAGLNDLPVYLRLVENGELSFSVTSNRLTGGGARKLLANLLDGDFVPPPDKWRVNDLIRPNGLDVFALAGGLRTATGKLTPAGREYLHRRDPDLLLAAFETWAQSNAFDELLRLDGLKRLSAARTWRTTPSPRRAAIIEGLSWCPTDVWIEVQEFCRALQIWHFDFEIEGSAVSNIKTADLSLYSVKDPTYWAYVKTPYVKAVLWEYLGALGALDLLFAPRDLAAVQVVNYAAPATISRYDGLFYFRINKLGAFLLGQADAYTAVTHGPQALCRIQADGAITVLEPERLLPNTRLQLEQLAAPLDPTHYQLDNQRILDALAIGQQPEEMLAFLAELQGGEPVDTAVATRIQQLADNARQFTRGAQALFINVRRPELVAMALADPALGKFTHQVDARTLVIPAQREKRFRERLKELEYLLR